MVFGLSLNGYNLLLYDGDCIVELRVDVLLKLELILNLIEFPLMIWF